MWEILQEKESQLVIWITILATLVALGLYVIRRFPRSEEDGKVNTSDMMSTFRELHAQGKLSEEEYRTIKTKLAARLKDELSKDDEEPDDTEFRPE